MALNRIEMMLRVPAGLKKAIETHAEANLRSINSEILARLAHSLNGNTKGDARQLSLGLAGEKPERTKHGKSGRRRSARRVNRTNRKSSSARAHRTTRKAVKA